MKEIGRGDIIEKTVHADSDAEIGVTNIDQEIIEDWEEKEEKKREK